MFGNTDNGFTPQATGDYPMDEEEDYMNGPSNQHNDFGPATTTSEYLENHHHQVPAHSEGFSESADQYHLLSCNPTQHYTEVQACVHRMHNGLSNNFFPLESTSFPPLSANGNSYEPCHRLNTIGQYHYGAMTDGQQDTEALTNIGAEGLLQAASTSGNAYNDYVETDCEQLDDMDWANTEPMPASTSVIQDAPGSSTVNPFVSGVLVREPDHQQQLISFTDGLLFRVGTQGDDGEVQPNFSSSSVGFSDQNALVDGTRASVNTPTFLHTIEEQAPQTLGPVDMNTITGALSTSFPMVPSPSVAEDSYGSDYQSRVTPNDHLMPSLSPRVFVTPSPTNAEPPSDILHCRVEGCDAIFTGIWRKTNARRHYRERHTGKIKNHRCKEPTCPKTFKRKDALLKHHRTHPHLGTPRAISRKSSSSMGVALLDADPRGSMHNADQGSIHDGEASSYGYSQNYRSH